MSNHAKTCGCQPCAAARVKAKRAARMAGVTLAVAAQALLETTDRDSDGWDVEFMLDAEDTLRDAVDLFWKTETERRV